jgi:hypothetical protein
VAENSKKAQSETLPSVEIAVFATDAELLVDAAELAARIGWAIRPELVDRADPSNTTTSAKSIYALLKPPTPTELVELAKRRRLASEPWVFAFVGASAEHADALALAGDLGLVACEDIGAAMAAMALLVTEARAPWAASLRDVSTVDRARLTLPEADVGSTKGPRFLRLHDGCLAWGTSSESAQRVGSARDAAAAANALLAAETDGSMPHPDTDGKVIRAAREVLFGPPRALSDPASKSALRHYGLPLPVEDLCASPSRASTEATRLGFPVRIALTSPDLRVWDHPDLADDTVMNAAQVRDVFRQLTTLANVRNSAARVLGVTVTATTQTSALLEMEAEPIGDSDAVLLRIGFADAHGLASGDSTVTVLPASEARIERALGRLLGSELLLGGRSAALRQATFESIRDVIVRVGQFVHEHRAELESVELRPVAVIAGGRAEVREACVHVGDAFAKHLDEI